MPKELNFEELEAQIEANFSHDQREFIARLLHDHVSGLVTTLAMQVEIVKKMVSRNMDIAQEVDSLKENMSNASQHIVAIEKAIRVKRE